MTFRALIILLFASAVLMYSQEEPMEVDSTVQRNDESKTDTLLLEQPDSLITDSLMVTQPDSLDDDSLTLTEPDSTMLDSLGMASDSLLQVESLADTVEEEYVMTAEDWFNQALDELNQGEYNQALESFTTADTLGWEHERLVFYKALTYYNIGKDKNEEFKVNHPGRALFEDYRKALTLFDTAFVSQPQLQEDMDYAEACYIIALDYFRAGNIKDVYYLGKYMRNAFNLMESASSAGYMPASEWLNSHNAEDYYDVTAEEFPYRYEIENPDEADDEEETEE
jgi:tetratricopeptide (TPR) repeat protein